MGQRLGQIMLAHELIRKDIEIVDVVIDKTYSSDNIQTFTRYIKHQIYNHYNGKTVGKIVYVDTNDFFIVVCSMIASWELGASIFLNDVDPKIKILPYFKAFYKVIDIVIGSSRVSMEWLHPHHLFVSTDNIHSILGSASQPFEYALDQPITADTICYYTTSSGTTADPKILPFTHYQTVVISNEIKQYLELAEDDRPYHYKTLHHGSLFNSYALPLLNSCRTHYSGILGGGDNEISILSKISQCIVKHKFTHFLVPYHYIREFPNLPSMDFDHKVTLITIIGNTQEDMCDLFERFHPKQVVNYFGTSEVGTMFISRTTKNNLDEYRLNRFTDLTSFIDYQILENKVRVKWKHATEWYETSDVMKEDNGVFWFYGRDLYFTCQQKQVSLISLDQVSLHGLVAKFLNTYDFILVPDHQLEKLYLNLYDRELSSDEVTALNTQIADQFGKEFCIADIFNFNPEDLKFGMKVNGPLLLHLFRERKKTNEIFT
jgi:hypothetical protein